MRDDLPWFLVIGDPLLFVGFVYFVWHYIAELRFYRKSQWNFLIDNPKGKKFYAGEEALPDESNLLSNKGRLATGYPFVIFVLAVLFGSFSWAIYAVQSCPFADLKQCGLEVTTSSVSYHSPTK